MARNLIKAGHELVLYNRTRSRAEELQPLGARVTGTPGEAASGVEALITMLADDRAVEDAMLCPGQALQSLSAGAVHVGMSTSSVALSRRLAAAHTGKAAALRYCSGLWPSRGCCRRKALHRCCRANKTN